MCPWAVSRIPELASTPPVLTPSCVLLTVVISQQKTNAEEAVLQLEVKDTEKQKVTARSVINRCSPFPGEGNGNPLQYACLENPMDGGAW